MEWAKKKKKKKSVPFILEPEFRFDKIQVVRPKSSGRWIAIKRRISYTDKLSAQQDVFTLFKTCLANIASFAKKGL